MQKLGYISQDDLLVVNGTVLKALCNFNLYGENRKFSWNWPDEDERNISKWLLEKELVVEDIGNTVDVPTFSICHVSPNIFSLEEFFSDYSKALELLDISQVHVAGIWFNVSSKHPQIRDLFNQLQDDEITADKFLKEFTIFFDEYKEISQ